MIKRDLLDNTLLNNIKHHIRLKSHNETSQTTVMSIKIMKV